MKLPRRRNPDENSSTIVQTLWLILGLTLLCAFTAYGAAPVWWGSRGAVLQPQVVTNNGVVTTNYISDDYAVATQGQLKLFTTKAVAEMNANLSGGAGTELNDLVGAWAADYTANGYNANNIKPSDYTAMTAGQLKYVGNKVWSRLVTQGFTNAAPVWLAQNAVTDNSAANLGQLKSIFNFDLGAVAAATPTFNPAAGTYSTAQTVTITSVTSGATIYYTVDGTTPITTGGSPSSSIASGASITVSASETVKAIATASGYEDSGLGVAAYVIASKAAAPTFNPTGGTFVNPVAVQISSATTGATIYYTVDGSTPTTGSASITSGNTVIVAASETLKAIAAASGFAASDVASADYVVQTTAAPKFNPGSGTFTGPVMVVVTSDTPGATIYYTIDGSTPTTGSASIASGGMITVGTTTTITAFAVAPGYAPSPVTTATYSIPATGPPVFNPPGGTYSGPITVQVTTTTPGATIYYTTNGSAPTTSSSVVTSGGISVGTSLTIRALVVASGFSSSSGSATYVIQTNTANPVFNPPPGTYYVRQPITISSTTPGATIYYTTDGSTPTTSSTSISSGGTLSVNSGVTLKALAVATGYNPSGITTGIYQYTGEMAGGASHGVALRTDGSVWTWGLNNKGQLGIGSTTQANAPVKVTTLSGITAIAAGAYHTVALKSDGTVWAWGLNTNGQVGDGTVVQRNSPVQVSGLTSVVAITAGSYHNYALKSDGTVWAWGLNTNGQVGDGTVTQRNSPVQVSGLTGVTQISAGGYHGLALISDGSVYAWGLNTNGQLGDATTTQRNSPQVVPGLSGITSVSAGIYFSVALTGTGNVYTWGFNGNGQIGDGTLTQRSSPVQLAGISNVAQICAEDGYQTVAIKTDGTAWAWGYNFYGQCGFGAATSAYVPTQITGISNVITAGAGQNFCYLVRNDGKAYSFGFNLNGQLGYGTPGARANAVQILGLGNIAALSTNGTASLALDSTGQVLSFGLNANGELGNNQTSQPASPQAILTGISAIANSTYASAALKSDGTVLAWGDGFYGLIGNGLTRQQNTPTAVSTISSVTAISSSGRQVLALESDGSVWAWGSNNFGQLGDNTTTQRNSPVKVSGLSTVTITAIAEGQFHSLALDSTGKIWAWGNNTNGQLGDGTTTEQHLPVQVTGLSSVTIVAVSAGQYHSMALDSTGHVWTWGLNSNGQVGDGTVVQRTSPVMLAITGITAISAGDSFSLALKNDKTVYAWGSNSSAELGDGTTAQRTSPVQVANLVGITKIAAGPSHSLALKEDGSVQGWGYNASNVIGVGPIECAPVPMVGLNLLAYLPTPSVSITAPANNTSAPQNQVQTFTASASETSGTIANVKYYIDATLVGSSTSGGAYTINWTPTSWGNYTFTAIATDSNGNTSQNSSPITLIVPYGGATVATPTFNPGTGSYATAQDVTISCATPGATIYYTTNNSTPSPTNGTAVSSGATVTISTTTTLKAMAVASGYANSAVGSVVITIQTAAATPTFNPVAGSYTSVQNVVISSATTGATIYYTTNGSDPDPASSASISSGASISVGTTETVKAIAVAAGYNPSAIASATYTITLPTATPSFSPGPGTYANPVNVTITCATSGASIYYTLDNSPATALSTPYTPGAQIPITSTTIIRAVAIATGFGLSPEAIGTYNFVAATPAFSPAGGTYTTIQTVTLTSASTGASIYYEVGATAAATATPTASSTLYTGPIAVSSTQTIKAIAIESGFSNSSVASASYTINLPTAVAPIFSPVAATYTSIQTVTISSPTSGAAIYYETGASTGTTATPTASSTLYAGPITVSATQAIKAIAIATGYKNSTVTNAAYTINLPTAGTPTFSPAGATYTSVQTVTISSTATGASIYYETGTSAGTTATPTASSTPYTAPITVGSSKYIKAIAIATGYKNSLVGGANYVINLGPATAPTFSPGTGTYYSAQSVTLSSPTPGAVIYYEAGTTAAPPATPTSSSTLYSTAITVGTSAVMKALTIAPGYTNSSVTTATYTINAPPADAPTFSVDSLPTDPTDPGDYSGSTDPITVRLASTTPNATIYYEMGTTPTGTANPSPATSTVYPAQGITVAANSVAATNVIKAVAVASGFSTSSIATMTYTLPVAATAPTFSPASGASFTNPTLVTMTSSAGSRIFYTLDGTAPDLTSASIASGSTLMVSIGETINAIAGGPGYFTSPSSSATYTVTNAVTTPPIFSPSQGNYPSGQQVTIISATPGATIYYTTDGSTPSNTSSVVPANGVIAVTTTQTIKAFAVAQGNSPSSVTSAKFTILTALPTPSFSPVPGAYPGAVTVTLTSQTNATIHYTLDGTDPTTTSTPTKISGQSISISGPITVLKALATNGTSSAPSFIATGTYTIGTALPPTFSLESGTYSGSQSVTISPATSGSTIHFTTDGSIPNASSPTPSGPLTVDKTETVQAIATINGLSSSVVSKHYVIQPADVPDQPFMVNLAATGPFQWPANPILVVKVTHPDSRSIRKVEIFQSGITGPVATLDNAPYQYVCSALNQGIYGFTAKATDDLGNVASGTTEFIVSSFNYATRGPRTFPIWGSSLVALDSEQGILLDGIQTALRPDFPDPIAKLPWYVRTKSTTTGLVQHVTSVTPLSGVSGSTLSTTASHGLSANQYVVISGGLTTNNAPFTNLNGTYVVSNPTGTTFKLKAVGGSSLVTFPAGYVANSATITAYSTYNKISTSTETNGSHSVSGAAPPMAIYGDVTNAPPLYTNQNYRFGVAAGGQTTLGAVVIKSMTYSTGTVETETPHGLSEGQTILLSGVTTGVKNTPDTDLNGRYFKVDHVLDNVKFVLKNLDGSTAPLPRTAGTYNPDTGIINRSVLWISSVDNSSGSTVFTTSANHGLRPGRMIVISGSNIALNGTYLVKTAAGATLTLSKLDDTVFTYSGGYTANNNVITNADFKVEVYLTNDFSGSGASVRPIYTEGFTVPNPTIPAAWQTFVDNDYVQDYLISRTVGGNTIDFDTKVQVEAAPAEAARTFLLQTWGQQVNYALRVTHRAGNANYYYKISYMGVADPSNTNSNLIAFDEPALSTHVPMALDSTGTDQTFNLDYGLNFTDLATNLPVFTGVPQFQGTPLPPAYQNMSVEELIGMSPAVQDVLDAPGSPALNALFAPSNGDNPLKRLDGSPELRTHQVLDKFVSAMNGDPIALANYVQNEISLTDAVGLNPGTGLQFIQPSSSAIASFTLPANGDPSELITSTPHHLSPGQQILISNASLAALNGTYLVATTPTNTRLTVLPTTIGNGQPLRFSGAYTANSAIISSTDTSINPQGVRRNALATFMEGQGSPVEQCALLVYLLRKAGYSCAYVFPDQDQMMMIDAQLSRILRMQIQGGIGPTGAYNVPELIPVNFPWVTAYVDGHWVHLFPWLKDTVVQQGRDVWQFMPKGYQTGSQWLQHYLMNDPAIRQLTTPGGLYTDDINVLFPLFVQQQLQGTNLSLDELGTTSYNRQNYFTRWQDFPRPWQTPVVNNGNLAQNLDASQNSVSLKPALQNIFDTINIDIFSDRYRNGIKTGPEPEIQTGDLNLVDLHDRRLLLYHTVAKNSAGAVITQSNTDGTAYPVYRMFLSLEAFRDNIPARTSPYSFNAGTHPDQSGLLESQQAYKYLNYHDDILVYNLNFNLHQQAQAIPNLNSITQWATFLGVSEATKISPAPRVLRKGDTAALCLNYGKVTPQMEEFQAQKYWNYQQASASAPQATADAEKTQGQLLYLMGLTYFNKVSTLAENVGAWTNTNPITSLGYGLSKMAAFRDISATSAPFGEPLLGNRDLILVYPRVDMIISEAAFMDNGTNNLNSGDTGNAAMADAFALLGGGASAYEHMTINQFFGQSAAVSTVRLLDIAQGWTPGIPTPVVGSAAYISGGTIAGKSVTITGATFDASPAIITTSGAHGLQVGQSISISGVMGDTALNSTFIVASVPSSTTFTLRTSTQGGVATSPGLGSPGSNKPLLMTAANYGSVGATNYTVNSVTHSLKDWCGPNLWSQIVSGFSDPNNGPMTKVYITPGPVTAAKQNTNTVSTTIGDRDTSKYTGIGALVLGVGITDSLISGDMVIGNNTIVENGANGDATNFIFNYGLTNLDIGGLTLTSSGDDYSINWGGATGLSTSPLGSGGINLSPSSYYPPVSSYTNYGLLNSNLFSGTYVYNNSQLNTLNTYNQVYNPGTSLNLGSFGQGTVTINTNLLNTGFIGAPDYFGSTQSSGSSWFSLSGVTKWIADPVNVTTGEFYIDALDLKLNGPMPLEIRRTYGSLNPAQNNFGYGWRMSYFPYLMLSSEATYDSTNTKVATPPDLIYAAEMDGSVIAYRKQNGSSRWIPTADDNPTLSNPAGGRNLFNNHIEPITQSGGGVTGYTLTDSSGSVRTFAVNSFPVPGSTDITRTRPYLQKWTDNRGNFYNFNFGTDSTAADYGQVNKVSSSNGDFVAFAYNMSGCISQAFTGDGKCLYYQYDAFGDLTQVTLADGSNVTYDYQHDMAAASPGKAVDATILTKTYKASSAILANDGKIAITTVDAATGTFTAASDPHLHVNDTVVISGAKDNATGKPYSEINGTFTVSTVDATAKTFKLIAGKADAAPESTHQITQETKPNGRVLRNTYDSTHRVITQWATVGANRGLVQNATFSYGTGTTTITDVNRNQTKYYYTGNQITQVDSPVPNGPETGPTATQSVYQTWCTANDAATSPTDTAHIAPQDYYARCLKHSVDARNLQTDYVYDPNGNLRQLKLTGDLLGTGTSDMLTTTMTYNTGTITVPGGTTTVLNTLATVADQLGNGYDYQYDTTYKYLPNQITKKAKFNPVSITQLVYGNFGNTTLGAFGMVTQKTDAATTADAAVCVYDYSVNGFIKSKTESSGGVDKSKYPDVVMNYTTNLRGEITSETNASSGRSTQYAYDAMGHRTSELRYDEWGNLVSWNFAYYNLNGELYWQQGPRYAPNDYVFKHYDGAGRLDQEVKWLSAATDDGSGLYQSASYATTNYAYDAFGNMTEMDDPNQNATVMLYDAVGNMTHRTVHAGNSSAPVVSDEAFNYSANGELLTHRDALGGTETRTYTNTGKLKSDAMADGTSKSYQYDYLGRVVRETMTNGSYWRTDYTNLDLTVTRTLFDSSGAQKMLESQTFDRRGNVVAKTDLGGNTFTTNYDGLNRIMFSTGPGTTPQTVTYTYDAAGRKTTATNALGETTTTYTDALARPVKVVVTNSGGSIATQTTYAYSGDHNSVKTTVGTGGITAAAPSVTTTTYTDTRGNIILVRNAGNTYQATTYDANGNKTALKDEYGRVTTWTYDALNRVLSQTLPATGTEPTGAKTSYTYHLDSPGQTVTRFMPQGLTAKTVYDSAGRKTSEETDGSDSTATRHYQYSYYDSSSPFQGLLQYVVDPRGFRNQVTYDYALRTKSVNYDPTYGSTAAELRQNTSYDYDDRGMPTTITQGYATASTGPSTRVVRHYDIYGQRDTETVGVDNAGGSSFTTVSSWAQDWDVAGRRSALNFGLTASGPGTGSYGYQYNAAGLLTNVHADGQNFTYDYSDAGQLMDRYMPYNLSTRILLRDGRGRIRNENVQKDNATGSPTVFLLQNMNWKDDNRLDNYTFSGAFTSNNTGASELRQYKYDARGRLTEEPFTLPAGTSFVPYIANYMFDQTTVGTGDSHDGLGIRTAQLLTGGGLNGTPFDYATGQNSLSQVTNENVGTAVQYSYTYDVVGNVTSKGTTTNGTDTLTWDSFNRLIKIGFRNGSNPGFDWTVIYDGLGRRVQSTYTPVNSSSSGVTQTYYYDPQVEFLELGQQVTTSSGTTRHWNVYGPDRNGVYGGMQGCGGLGGFYNESDGVLKVSLNNFFGDSHGTVQGTTLTGNGMKFGGYGPMPGSSVSALTPGWRGHYLDLTGFYYMGARYYDSQSGRFLSADPMGHDASMSLYDYCNGDPVNGYDADGRWAGIDDAIATGVGALVGLIGQGISDLFHGHLSSWQNYVAAGIGGAAGGEATLYGGPLAGGLAYGAVTNGVRQGLNIWTGEQKTWDWGSFGTETVVSGAFSFVGGKALSAVANNYLSPSVKGAIGENLSYVYNTLKGNDYVGSQIAIPTVVDGGFSQAAGGFTRVDNAFLTREGDMLWVESKFGNARLEPNQILAQEAYDNYVVERWGYDFVEKVGGISTFSILPTMSDNFSNYSLLNAQLSDGFQMGAEYGNLLRSNARDPLSSSKATWK